jgi:hypothetical protein
MPRPTGRTITYIYFSRNQKRLRIPQPLDKWATADWIVKATGSTANWGVWKESEENIESRQYEQSLRRRKREITRINKHNYELLLYYT